MSNEVEYLKRLEKLNHDGDNKMSESFIFPTLYAKAKGGKIKVYDIRVDDIDGIGVITRASGYEDGKRAISKKEITKGKNIDKRNETSPYRQAQLEAQSKWNKKKDEAYVEDKAEIGQSSIILPMLAHTYSKIDDKTGKEKGRKKYIDYPCFVQPKLDGIRCVTYLDGDRVVFQSRKGKFFDTLEHLEPEVKVLLKKIGKPLDGELYVHERLTFQQITAAVKKKRDITKWIQYWVYDAVSDEPFETRYMKLHTLNDKPEKVIFVPTTPCNTEEDIMKNHEVYVADGFEGIIIRNRTSKYLVGHRSNDLQKHKDFIDEEFKIIGAKEATGEDKGTAVFRCITKDGKEFDVRPKGSRETRRLFLQDIDMIINRSLTIRYQNLSDDGIPRFPVGLSVRDYE